jgi:hypothetical protein
MPLLTRYAISALTCTAATAAGIDPDRVKPKRTIRAVRRRVADPAFPPDQPGSALEQVTADITSQRSLSKRRERTYPRVVKRGLDPQRRDGDGVPGLTGVAIKSVFVSAVSENEVLVKVAAGRRGTRAAGAPRGRRFPPGS